MCGRFVLETPLKATAEIFNAQMTESLVTVPNFNICPSDDISVLVSNLGKRKLGQMRWGFVPHWYKSVADGHYYLMLGPKRLLKNLRSETLALKGDV